MVSRERFAKHIRMFLVPIAIVAGVVVGTSFSTIARAKVPAKEFAEAAEPPGFCATQFEKLSDFLFIQYKYKSGTGVVAATAEDFNRGWLRVTPYDFRKNAKYIQNSIDSGHPQIKFLEDLGFKFDFKNGHTIPSMSEINSRYAEKIEKLIAEGKVRREDVLKPVRMFQTMENGKRKLIGVALDADAPLGATPVNDVLREGEFTRFVAEGQWPIGELMRATDGQISFTFHDLGHLGAFSRNPEFMASIRNFARTRVAENRLGIADRKINLILESLALGRADAKPAFDHSLIALGIKQTGSEPRSFWDYLNGLSKVSNETIDREIQNAYTLRNQTTNELGGVRSDAVTGERARAHAEGLPYLAPNENPKSLLERAYDAKDSLKRRTYFAQYLSSMDHTMRMKAEDWLNELKNHDRLTVGSPIYRYLCTSGIYSTDARFYVQFCSGKGHRENK